MKILKNGIYKKRVNPGKGLTTELIKKCTVISYETGEELIILKKRSYNIIFFNASDQTY